MTRQADFPKLMATLHMNRKMWRIFVADVFRETNHLPTGLKARIAYLYEFVCIHTKKVVEEGASIEPLIDINLAVTRGLSEHWNNK